MKKENNMTQSSDRQMASLVQMLQKDPSLSARLPQWEGDIVQRALDGASIYEIAQHMQMTEAAIWEVLASAARAATGQPVQDVERGGLGSDTDPGVTSGYDETGFGRLAADPPLTPEDVNTES
jgi:hypothetical protein